MDVNEILYYGSTLDVGESSFVLYRYTTIPSVHEPEIQLYIFSSERLIIQRISTCHKI